MQLDDVLIGKTGCLVQSVNVLSNHGLEQAHFLQPGQRQVGGIGLGLDNPLIKGNPAAPVFLARIFGRHEFVEIDRPEFILDTALTAVVGDSAFSRYPGSGEDDVFAALLYFLGN